MHHDIGTFCLLSFLISLGKCLLNLLIFFKKQTFGFNYFFCVFCFLLYWFPLFIISCFLLTLDLICLSSSSLLKWEFQLLTWKHFAFLGFPESSVGKESSCNAGDPSLIPGLGRSAGEGLGYPLQYSWASLVAQLVKNPPAMQETWVRPLEKGKATHSSILA